jgi:hypothetical protein
LTLPNFFTIGAFRSGTTSLAAYLAQHPQVFVPAEKEPNFFAIDGNPHVSEELRARSITTRASYEELYAAVGTEIAIADISPEYLRTPTASEVIHAQVPDARLAAVLRDPAQRAYSDYLMHVRDGKERAADFGAALDADERRLDDGGVSASRYLAPGLYASQLARYFDRFPRTAIHVMIFDDLVADADTTLRRLFVHIGVDDTVTLDDIPSYNSGGVPRNAIVGRALSMRRHVRPYLRRQLLDRVRPLYERTLRTQLTRPPLQPCDRARLVEFYRDEVSTLETMIDRDLSRWLEASPC